jgi:hypothetical protein
MGIGAVIELLNGKRVRDTSSGEMSDTFRRDGDWKPLAEADVQAIFVGQAPVAPPSSKKKRRGGGGSAEPLLSFWEFVVVILGMAYEQQQAEGKQNKGEGWERVARLLPPELMDHLRAVIDPQLGTAFKVDSGCPLV